jgi:hypothetical protein
MAPRKEEKEVCDQDRWQQPITRHTNASSGRMGRMRSTSKELTCTVGFRSVIGGMLRSC